MWTLRGTIRGDPQETLSRVRSPILFVRSFSDVNMYNHIEAERSVWVMGPSSGKEQQCGSHAKLSRHRYMCAKSARAWARELVEALGTSDAQFSLLCWMIFPPWRPFLVQRRNHLSVDVLSLILCNDRNQTNNKKCLLSCLISEFKLALYSLSQASAGSASSRARTQQKCD